MSTQSDSYPGFERIKFESLDEELKAVLGLQSSSDYEAKAKLADFMVKCACECLDIWREHRAIYEKFAVDESETPAFRAEAACVAATYTTTKELAQENVLQQKQEFADEMHQKVAQAKRFESRWTFDPYTDPLLERLAREAAAQTARKISRRKKK